MCNLLNCQWHCTAAYSLQLFRLPPSTLLTSYATLALIAACHSVSLWNKLRQSNTVPHLARWFDHHAALPACTAAVVQLDPKQKAAAAAAADLAAGKGGGGECCHHGRQPELPVAPTKILLLYL